MDPFYPGDVVRVTDEGDLLAIVHGKIPNQYRSFLVSSNTLKTASPIFASMLRPRPGVEEREQQQLPRIQVRLDETTANRFSYVPRTTTVNLPYIYLVEDDIDAMDFIFRVLHPGNTTRALDPQTLTTAEISAIATQEDKYQLGGIIDKLEPWAGQWSLLVHPVM